LDPASTFATDNARTQASGDGATESFEVENERKFHSYEVFLAGIIASLMVGFTEQYLSLAFIHSYSSFPYDSYVTSTIFFLVNPCLVFFIMYFWLGGRIVSFFRQRFLRISLLLFLAGATGITISAISYPVLLYFPRSAAFSTFTFELFSVFYYVTAAIGEGVGLMFVGFAAITIAYFRKSKNEMADQIDKDLKAQNTDEPAGGETDDIKQLPDDLLQKELVSMKTIEHVLVPLVAGGSQKDSAHSFFETRDILSKAKNRISLLEEEQRSRKAARPS
jgi:hypothetical protein